MKNSGAHRHHSIVLSFAIMAGCELLTKFILYPILFVLQRCGNHNTKCTSETFASKSNHNNVDYRKNKDHVSPPF